MRRSRLRPTATILAASLSWLPGCSAPAPVATPPPAPAEPPAPAAPASLPHPPPPPDARPELPTAAGVRYLEIVTGGAKANDVLPMLVAIHGLGDDPAGFSQLVAELPTPARVILPRGLDPHPPGWSWFPIRARDPDVAALSRGIRHAAEAVAAMTQALQRRRPTIGRPVVTGFSQGGMLAFALAVHYPDLFAAAFPVGGWLPPPLWPGPSAAAGSRPVGQAPAPPQIHAFHGDADRAVRHGPTQAAIEHLRASGFPVQLSTYPGVGHAIPPPMAAELRGALVLALQEQRARAAATHP